MAALRLLHLQNDAPQHHILLNERRISMAKNRFAKALSRFAHSFGAPTRERAEERYLEGSASIYDLERRMQEIDRGKFRNF
ncbi:DUF3563 family protein [Oricola indica]|uniref:DUF3563 family protein n=1 Tax=Oricola indica TaxID=2872591 RepID=UPI003CCBBB44